MFEKPEKKNVQQMAGASVEYEASFNLVHHVEADLLVSHRRLSRLEGQYLVMQSHLIGMQSSLDRILNTVVQTQAQANAGANAGATHQYPPTNGAHAPSHRNGDDRHRSFPPLPGFAPPVRPSCN